MAREQGGQLWPPHQATRERLRHRAFELRLPGDARQVEERPGRRRHANALQASRLLGAQGMKSAHQDSRADPMAPRQPDLRRDRARAGRYQPPDPRRAAMAEDRVLPARQRRRHLGPMFPRDGAMAVHRVMEALQHAVTA